MRPDAFDDDEFLLLPEVVLLPGGPVRGWAAVVSSGEFAMVGEADAVAAAHPGLRPVHLDRHLLMPGFVDAHHHLTQTFGKALAFGEPSEIFRRIWVPLEQQLTEESAHVAAKLAAFESLRGGFHHGRGGGNPGTGRPRERRAGDRRGRTAVRPRRGVRGSGVG